MTKALTIVGCFLDNVGHRDLPLLDRYFALLLEGTDVSFAEVIPCKPNSACSCLYRLVSIGQGFNFYESIRDCDQALEALLSISRNILALHDSD